MAPKGLVRRLEQLKAARESGVLSPDNYQKALLELRVKDNKGTWWAVDPATNGLIWYDQTNEVWVPAQTTKKAGPPNIPPALVQAQPPPTAASPQTGQENKVASRGPTAKELIGTLKRAVEKISPPVKPSASAQAEPVQAVTSLKPQPEKLGTPFSGVTRKAMGPLLGIMALIISAGLSMAGWEILGYIPSTTRSLASPASCQGLTSSVATFFCSFNGAGFAMLGSILVALVMFLLRWPLTKMSTSLVKPLSPHWRAFFLSLMAAMFFAMVWSGSHPIFSAQTGFIEEDFFPALIGLFTYITVTCHQGLQRRMDGFFTRRDKVSKWRRLAVAMAVPSILSILLRMGPRPTRLVADQTVVLVSLILGYLLFTPRSGAPAGQDPWLHQGKKTSA